MSKKSIILHEDTGVLRNQVRRSQGAQSLLTIDDETGALSLFDGTSTVDVGGNSTPAPGTTVTATGTLPASSLGTITPVNAASATVQTLPPAAAAWASNPYGLVVLSIKGAGIPTFAAGAGDTLRATSGIAGGVQYGMIAAQIVSATEWALA